MRILHIPGRTPYARKLRAEDVQIVNETTSDGVAVPRDASFEWVEQQASLDFFDVLHVQALELMSLASMRAVLQRCAAERKAVVATIHDLVPLFPDETPDFAERMKLVCQSADALVTLTARARTELAEQFHVAPSRISIVPHGAVLPSAHPLWQAAPQRNPAFTIGMFGGFRPNRSFIAVAVNALFGLGGDVRVRILSRGLNPIELQAASEAAEVARLASANPRLTLELLPFPSDDRVAQFVHELDLLALPYLCGTHSGQLELAMDLGVPVVAPRIGCYAEQWRLHERHVPPPFWFDFDARSPYGFGAPLLEALHAAHEAWRARPAPRADRSRFQQERTREHAAIIAAHAALYARALDSRSAARKASG